MLYLLYTTFIYKSYLLPRFIGIWNALLIEMSHLQARLRTVSPLLQPHVHLFLLGKRFLNVIHTELRHIVYWSDPT